MKTQQFIPYLITNMLQVPEEADYLVCLLEQLEERKPTNIKAAYEYHATTQSRTIAGIFELLTGKPSTKLSKGTPEQLQQRIDALRSICLALLH